MKLGTIYKSLVAFGIEADPRGTRAIKGVLSKTAANYRKLSAAQKKFFDKDALVNPYADTRILYGDPQKDVRRIMVGIDIDVAELLLADQLRQRGEEVDLVISHHPAGYAYARFFDVMSMQIDMLANLGIDKDVAADFLSKRMKEVERRVLAANHTRPVDAARLLDIPFMCVHTPADNHVQQYIAMLIKTKKPKTLGVIMDVLQRVPEYRQAMKNNAGPKILVGDPKKKAGKIIVDMTGGTEGSRELFGRLSQAGVNTIIAMHLSEEHFKKVESEHINVIIAGHISSDALGVNRILDKLERKERFDCVDCSGFTRVRR